MIKAIQYFWTASIKRQLILGIALVHAVMMSIFVVDLVEKERDFLTVQHNKTAKSLTKTLASASTSWVLANDVVGLKEVVTSIEYYPGISYVIVLNLQGQVLAHTDKQYLGKYLSDDKSIAFLKGDIETKSVFENDSYIDVVSPILRDNQHIGWARIALNKNEINQGLYNVTLDGLIYILIAILIGILFGYFMSIGITKGLYEILESIKKVKDGNQDAHSNLDRIDEIGVLSYEFDNMIDVIKASKEELNTINERHELTLNGLKDGIWDWDIKTDKAYFSKSWKGMLGYEDQEIKNNGKAFFNLVHDEDKEKVKNALHMHFKNPLKNKYLIEVRLKCKDGSYKWVLSRGKVLLDDSNNPVRMLGYHSDITIEKEHEAYVLKQQKEMLEQSRLAAMGEMIGNIAHQWRQPLSAISMNSNNIMADVELDIVDNKALLEYCHNINEQAQYLSNTIDDFKNFVKGERKKTLFKLEDSINSFIKLVYGAIKSNNIKLELDIDKNIQINGYSNELIQCYINIFNNAKDILKTINEDERVVFISTTIENNKAVIRIKDNAGGIPEEILPKIFEPYFSTKHQSVGTGLGLHMTYNLIVEGMKGTIDAYNVNYEFNSKQYTGAEFRIILPFDIN